MARYIDADKFAEQLRMNYCKDCNNYNGVRCSACEIDDALDFVEDTPTADVVEVVRCKDCFYFKDFGECNRSGIECMADDFCSYGERRDT